MRSLLLAATAIGLMTSPVLVRRALADAATPIANSVPSFRTYDVDRRERWMRRTIAAAAGTPTFSHQDADIALGRLDDIRRNERAQRSRDGGHLKVRDIRAIDEDLNRLANDVQLRQAGKASSVPKT